MSYAERQIWIEIVSSSIVILLFVLVLSSQAQAGHFSGPDGFQTWARTVLMLIGAGIAVAIGVSIAFAIGHAIVTGERGSDLIDERDRLIAGFGWKVTSIVSSAGFIGALGLMGLGYSTLVALNLLLAAFAISDTAGNLAKLWRYRRGG